MPWEYIELVLCRDIYHCKASELDKEDWGRMMEHLSMYNVEKDIENMRKQVQAEKEKQAAARARAKSRRRR